MVFCHKINCENFTIKNIKGNADYHHPPLPSQYIFHGTQLFLQNFIMAENHNKGELTFAKHSDLKKSELVTTQWCTENPSTFLYKILLSCRIYGIDYN